MDFYEGMNSSAPLLSKALGKTPEEIEILVAETSNEFREQKVHLFQQICFCYARKPEKP
jgi:hypothetical protein